jgi:hypothetical protein
MLHCRQLLLCCFISGLLSADAQRCCCSPGMSSRIHCNCLLPAAAAAAPPAHYPANSDAYMLLHAALPQSPVQQWYFCSGSDGTSQPMLVLL